MLRRICRLRLQAQYYTGNFRFWCARPLIADASLCPAITRTPSSIRAITLSAVQPCRKAMPLLRQAASQSQTGPEGLSSSDVHNF